MVELTYKAGLSGRVHDLESGLMWGGAFGLRSRSWSYSLGYRTLYGQVRKAREVTVTMNVLDANLLDAFMADADADMVSGKPGLLSASAENGDMWTQHAYLVKSETTAHYRAADAGIDLTIVLLDGVWRREQSLTVIKPIGQRSEWLNYPYDYPYNYQPSGETSNVSNDYALACPVKLTFQGPCTNPHCTIAGNRYQVDVDVPAGCHVLVDGTSNPKTVTLVDSHGLETNVFDKAHRGDGLDTGEYIFQPIPAGRWPVAWPGTYTLTVTTVMERSEPAWIS